MDARRNAVTRRLEYYQRTFKRDIRTFVSENGLWCIVQYYHTQQIDYDAQIIEQHVEVI
jgi:hypothetical protein